MPKITMTIECDSQEEAAKIIEAIGGETKTTDKPKAATSIPAEKIATLETVTGDPNDPDDAVRDADGMSYDPEIHTATRAMTADGLWKSRRGKSDEAKAARAAFKAAGGNITPPTVDETTDTPGLPGAETKSDTPGLPGAETIPSAKPVTVDEFYAEAGRLLGEGSITEAQIQDLYQEAAGIEGVSEAVNVLRTNETVRSLAMKMLAEYDVA